MEQSQQNNKNLRTLISQNLITATISANGEVLNANALFCEIFNVKKNEVEGNLFATITDKYRISPIDILDSWHKILEGESITLLRTYQVNQNKFILKEMYTSIMGEQLKSGTEIYFMAMVDENILDEV
jgi:hypothetical protein